MGSEQVSISHPPDSDLPSAPSLPPDASASMTASHPLPLRLEATKRSGTSVSSSPAPGKQTAEAKRSPLPFSFPVFFRASNTSSTSLAPSTAEGKPIPLDNSTTEHRTSALRELSINFPSPVSRHRYAKSTGAQSSTYSQPVIVRTYSGPVPSQQSQPSRKYRPQSAAREISRRVPWTAGPSTASYTQPTPASRPFGPVSLFTSSRDGISMNGAGPGPKRRMPWHWQSGSSQSNEAKLPSKEAFLFKNFLSNLEEQESGRGVGSDLDRLAEICARSRYSLSNQYEVHIRPHGSGASFVESATVVPGGGRRRGRRHHHHHAQQQGELTLQAVPSDDDENSSRGYRRRRGMGRRKSMAYGTLETIMSSSRSSEEDKTKKKSAAEIAEEVRGRAARKHSDQSGTTRSRSGPASGQGQPPGSNTAEAGDADDGSDGAKKAVRSRRKSASFASAVMDNTRHATQGAAQGSSPRGSAAALVSEPAQPQASTSHLEIRTAPDLAYGDDDESGPSSPDGSERSADMGLPPPTNAVVIHSAVTDTSSPAGPGILSGLNGWMTWRPGVAASDSGLRSSNRSSGAEGRLRQLLLNGDRHEDKGKAVVHYT